MTDKLIDLICAEFGLEKADVDEDTMLEEIAGDEFELQALAEAIEGEFEIEVDFELDMEWTISNLADKIGERY